MSENEEPDWLAELAKSAMALRQQTDDSSEALRRQVDQLVQGAERFVRDAQRTVPGGPVPPFQLRVVRVAGSVIGGFVPAAGYPGRAGFFRGYVRGSPTVTVSGSLALPAMRFGGDVDVATVAETEVAKVGPDRRRGLAVLSDGEIVFLVLVWIYAVWLPWFGSRLPPELHAMLSDSYGTIAIAVAITWRRFDKHK